MEIKSNGNALTGTNATVMLESGDHISVAYKNSRGEFNVFNVSAQHLVFLASHEQTGSTMIVRPSTGLQFVEGNK